VSELAAGGQTNREIAQTLFVTEKTVETYVGRAFRTLDDLAGTRTSGPPPDLRPRHCASGPPSGVQAML
jgi:transposase